MLPNPDFKDLLSALNAHGVEFLIVGAHALAAHGHVRATKDLDVWVRPDPANARRLLAALRAFGAPTHAVTQDDFSAPGITFQIGVEPVRIDIITAVDGLTFEPAWQNRVTTAYGGVPVFVISRDDFIKNKRASARPQDLADIAALERRNLEMGSDPNSS
jgi:hypothetical protein